MRKILKKRTGGDAVFFTVKNVQAKLLVTDLNGRREKQVDKEKERGYADNENNEEE